MCALAYASRVIHAESCSQKTLSAVQEFIFIALTHDCFPGCCLRHQELLHFRLQALCVRVLLYSLVKIYQDPYSLVKIYQDPDAERLLHVPRP